MAWSQDEIIFPITSVAAAGPLPRGAEEFEVRTVEGEMLRGVHISPSVPGPNAKTLILGFGGNAWNGQDVAVYLHEVYPDSEVAAFHYRGYRPSTGRPSAEALLADAPVVFDAAVDRIHPDRTVAVGFSIGSGVAASLAKRRTLDGIILVTPFDSLKAVANTYYPWLPIGALFRHEIDAIAALEGSKTPVAIISAGNDEVIPAARTDALRGKVSNSVFDRTISGASHNDIYGRSAFRDSMDQALEAVLNDSRSR